MLDKISKAGCKKRGLMQYKCMERQSRKLSMEGFHFPFCHAHREYSGRNAALAEGKPRIPVYRFLISLPDFPGPRDVRTDSADS